MDINYTGRDIQNVISLLVKFESEGVTDSRLIRDQLQSEFERRVNSDYFVMSKKDRIEASRRKSGIQERTKEISPSGSVCPECSMPTWHENLQREGIIYNACTNCRYSTLLARKTDGL